MSKADKQPLFEEIKEAVTRAGIRYHHGTNYDGTPNGDRGAEAMEIICCIIDKKISEAKLDIVQTIRSGLI